MALHELVNSNSSGYMTSYDTAKGSELRCRTALEHEQELMVATRTRLTRVYSPSSWHCTSSLTST